MQAEHVPEYERRWVDGLNHGDLSVADDVFAADCVIHITGSTEAIHGPAGFKQMMEGILAAFPDLHFTIEDQLSAGEKVAMRWSATGTHTGPLGSVSPTGRGIQITGLLLDHVQDGKVRERWEQWDQPAMMHQLGLA